MAKSGLEYQELVAMVAKALDPKADIKTGQWIEGPDGNREVDIEVRGAVDGKNHFVLIECKDWKRPIDVQAVDALDSKRRDLHADAAILYGNLGFSKMALRKAMRVGIEALSAVAEGNKLVKVELWREVVAKLLSVDCYNFRVYPSPESQLPFSEQWDVKNLYYDGFPVLNWLSEMSKDLLYKHEGQQKVIYTAAFKSDTPFTLQCVPVSLLGLRLEMTCSRKWLSQISRVDASLGSYNHITRRVIIPALQSFYPFTIDMEAWKEMDVDVEPEYWSRPLEPDSFEIYTVLHKLIMPIKGEATPPLSELIGDYSIETGDHSNITDEK